MFANITRCIHGHELFHNDCVDLIMKHSATLGGVERSFSEDA